MQKVHLSNRGNEVKKSSTMKNIESPASTLRRAKSQPIDSLTLVCPLAYKPAATPRSGELAKPMVMTKH
jgi:hypothetical protein